MPAKPTGSTGSAGLNGGGRRARGSLSQEMILDGAAFLVERDGLAGLSMPLLAKHLHSGVTSIYWHFRSKEELVNALTDRVSREMYHRLPPIGDGPWHKEAETYFASFRNLIRRNAVYREVFSYRSRFLFVHAAMAPSVLRRTEDGLGIFVRGGMTHEQAVAAYVECATYTRGFVVLEHHLEFDTAETLTAPNLLESDRFPILSQVGTVDRAVQLNDDQFALGLQLLIEGVRRRFETPV